METSPWWLGQGGKKGTHASVNLSLSPSARRMKGRRRKDHGRAREKDYSGGRRTVDGEDEAGRGKGKRDEERERERLTSAGERGRKCGWDGNEGRWRCSEVYEG